MQIQRGSEVTITPYLDGVAQTVQYTADLAVPTYELDGVGPLGEATVLQDLAVLTKLVTTRGKLFSRKRSGNCNKHQSQAITALKRARFLALMAFAQ